MSHGFLYFDRPQTRLKSYSSTTRSSGTSIVRIEIEVLDPLELGHLLKDLAEMKRPPAPPRTGAPPAPLLLEDKRWQE